MQGVEEEEYVDDEEGYTWAEDDDNATAPYYNATDVRRQLGSGTLPCRLEAALRGRGVYHTWHWAAGPAPISATLKRASHAWLQVEGVSASSMAADASTAEQTVATTAPAPAPAAAEASPTLAPAPAPAPTAAAEPEQQQPAPTSTPAPQEQQQQQQPAEQVRAPTAGGADCLRCRGARIQ